jgi:hypothetical protein
VSVSGWNSRVPPLAALLGFLSLLAPACDESLPPRESPPEVLVSDLLLGGGARVLIKDNAVATGGNFRIRTTNVYNEVLSDEALLRGQVTVRLKTLPDSVRTVYFDSTHLTFPTMLDLGILTIPVQQTVEMVAIWDQKTDHGTPFWMMVPLHQMWNSRGEPYFVSDSVKILVEGSVQLFEKVQSLPLPSREFTLIYYIADELPE